MVLVGRMRQAMPVRHYSPRTEAAYVQWVKRFLRCHGLRHPAELGEAEVAAFLSDLAVRGRVGAGTQNQALAALLFLYRDVLGRPLGSVVPSVRAKDARRLPQRPPHLAVCRSRLRLARGRITRPLLRPGGT